MYFFVFFYVFAIALTQVIAYPTDTEALSKTNDGLNEKADDFELFKFKLPKTIRHDYGMIIEGILNMSDDNFNVMLIDEDNENAPCRINFNYKENKTIEASPAVDDMANMAPFVLSSSEAKELNFFLHLKAFGNGGQMFEIQFEEVNKEISSMIFCKIESFEKLSHIMFKEGVKKIKSLQFTF